MPPLLRADPHRWGVGHVHLIDDERDRLMCGQTPARCPGDRFDGALAEITCGACLRSIEAKERQARLAEEWKRQEAIDQQNHAAYQQEWWERYDEYLRSTQWRMKRTRVLLRANGVCEGCGERRAVQVHHLRYPRGCFAGDPEWDAQEKLFDLRAVCRVCHDDVHREWGA